MLRQCLNSACCPERRFRLFISVSETAGGMLRVISVVSKSRPESHVNDVFDFSQPKSGLLLHPLKLPPQVTFSSSTRMKVDFPLA